MIAHALPVYIAFMALMPVLGRLLACFFRLDVAAGRALIFSGGTRSSLVVLPLALALPDAWVVTAAAVTQTIVELVGKLAYIRLVPSLVLPDEASCVAAKRL